MARNFNYDIPDLPELAFRKLGRKLQTLEGKGGGGSPPPPDPLIGQAALANAQLSKDALAWYKDVYAKNLQPRQAATDALSAKVIADQLDTSAQNKKQAADQWARYQSQFVPAENKMVQDALNYNTPAEQDRVAGLATADARQAIQSSTDALTRNLSRSGVAPGSGKSIALQNDNAITGAAMQAGAANTARTALKDKGIALTTGVANFGRNNPNTATQAFSTAMAANGGATNANSGANAQALGNADFAGKGYTTAINGNNSAGGLMNAQYGNQISAWNAQQQADAQSSAGLGNMAGELGAAAIRKW